MQVRLLSSAQAAQTPERKHVTAGSFAQPHLSARTAMRARELNSA